MGRGEAARTAGRERGERARARYRSREILSELKESPLTIPKKNSGGVSIPPPDPSYDQRKGFGPSFGNFPGVTGNGKLRPCGGREDPDPRPFVGADAYDRRPKFRNEIWAAGAMPSVHRPAGRHSRCSRRGRALSRPVWRYWALRWPRRGGPMCPPVPRRERLPCAKGAGAAKGRD